MPPTSQLTSDQFAESVKKKYPQYASVDNATLTQKLVAKYPQYKSRIAPEQPKSFGSKVAGAIGGAADFLNRNIGQPFIDVAAIPVQALAKKLGQPDPYADKALGGVEVNSVDDPLRKTGSAIQAASYLAPVGTIARGATALAKPVLGETVGKFAGNLAASAGTGYGVDVGMNLGQGKTGVEALKPGVGTGIGAALPFVPPALGAAARGLGKTTKFATSQATGLAPATIEEIIKNPSAFNRTAIREADRGEFAKNIGKTLKQEGESLSQTGKLYEPLRTAPGEIAIPDTTISDTLSKYGLTMKNGKILTSAESRPMAQGDIKAIEDFVKQYGGTKLSNNAYFNAKQRLSQLSKYETGRADTARQLARDLRGAYETVGDTQIPGLKSLDEKYAPLRKQINELSKDYLNRDGTLKDGAATKIANLTNKGREQILGRLEKARPGVTQEIKTLKAIEDIEQASGIKVGAYTRAGVGVGALLTGNIPAAVVAVASQPEIAVQLLRGFGYTKNQMADIARILSAHAQGIRFPGYEIFDRSKNYLEKNPPSIGLAMRETTTPEFRNQLKINVSKALSKLRLPEDLSKALGSADATFRLQQLAAKDAAGKTLTEAELREAIGLLRQQGIETVPGISPRFKQDKNTGKMMGSVPKALGGVPKTPAVQAFEGFDDLTTKLLDDLKGRATVSKQYLLDATNRPELKQAERDMFRNLLKDEPATINAKDFANKVKTELLPLKVQSTGESANTATGNRGTRYESVTLPDELRGPVADYKERVYNSPIDTSAADVHFDSGEHPGYFAHSRIEDLPQRGDFRDLGNGQKTELLHEKGDTRRVIELQSDLFQKGRLEGENVGFIDPKKAAAIKDPIKQKEYIDAQNAARSGELSKLEPYRNTWHERVIREEVKQAAKDGKTKLQFPTGETAMKIEGLGDNTRWSVIPENVRDWETPLTADTLKVGQGIRNGPGEDWIITDVLGDGKFKAVPKRAFDDVSIEEVTGASSPEDAVNMFLSEVENSKNGIEGTSFSGTDVQHLQEQFDISGSVDKENPIYKFYEKEVGKYLKNKYNAELITDPQGVKWWEVNVPKEAAKQPVSAFGKATLGAIGAGAVGSAALLGGLSARPQPLRK